MSRAKPTVKTVAEYAYNITTVSSYLSAVLSYSDYLLHRLATITNPYLPPPENSFVYFTEIYHSIAQLLSAIRSISADLTLLHRQFALIQLEGKIEFADFKREWVLTELFLIKEGLEELEEDVTVKVLDGLERAESVMSRSGGREGYRGVRRKEEGFSVSSSIQIPNLLV